VRLEDGSLPALYHSMLRGRRMEEAILEVFNNKEIVSTPHFSIGQEAVSAGVISNLRPTDRVVGTYRGETHALLKGVPMEAIFAEVLGRAGGVNRGYGGPMHITDPKVGMMGNFSIVGAGIPVAVGLGLASKLSDDGGVTVCFFGDGATNTGYFHEALNMAAVYETPTVFVIENNQYSEHTPIRELTKVRDLSEKAKAYSMRAVTGDGNDVEEVRRIAGEAVHLARDGWEPSLLEFRTYRRTGHSARDDETLEHPKEEREEWFARDPLTVARQRLDSMGLLSKEDEASMQAAVSKEVSSALDAARGSPWPVPSEMGSKVFADGQPEEVRPAGKGTLNATMRSAVNLAMAQSMQRDPKVLLFGEDVAKWGGVYKVSEGLLEKFGPLRVWDTPISESAMVGMGVGLALAGFRPIIEIMFADLLLVSMDAVGNSAAKKRWMSGGDEDLPLVIRCACGAKAGLPATHTETLDGLMLSIPGVKVVTPSNAMDAKGLLCQALRGRDPVIFFEHRLVYPESVPVPEDYYTIELGKAKVVREGTDVTMVSNMSMLRKSLKAAEALAAEDISAEVVDLRCVVPLDHETILKSVEKTGSLVTVEEAPTSGGWSSLVAAKVAESGFRSLKRPVRRISLADVPIPYSTPLVEGLVPTEQTIASEVKRHLKG